MATWATYVVLLHTAPYPLERSEKLWCLLALPLAGTVWCGRQTVLPDADKDAQWRIRNAIGCGTLAVGATVMFVMGHVPDVAVHDPDSYESMGWGIEIGFNLGLPALGVGVVTFIWGLVDWLRALDDPARTRQ